MLFVNLSTYANLLTELSKNGIINVLLRLL